MKISNLQFSGQFAFNIWNECTQFTHYYIGDISETEYEDNNLAHISYRFHQERTDRRNTGPCMFARFCFPPADYHFVDTVCSIGHSIQRLRFIPFE